MATVAIAESVFPEAIRVIDGTHCTCALELERNVNSGKQYSFPCIDSDTHFMANG